MSRSLDNFVEVAINLGKQWKEVKQLGKFSHLLIDEHGDKIVIRRLPSHIFPLHDAERMCTTHPDVYPRLIASWHSEDSHTLALEYIEGKTLDFLLKRGEVSESELVDKLLELFRDLNRHSQPSSVHAFKAEVERLRDDFLVHAKLPRNSADDLDVFFERLFAGADELAQCQRFSCGDFISSNIVVDNTGKLRIVDVDFAELTHFYHEDLLRQDVFGGFKQKLFDEHVQLRPEDRVTCRIHFWIRQAILESKLYPAEKAVRCVLSDLARLPFGEAGLGGNTPASYFIIDYLRDIELPAKDDERERIEAAYRAEIVRISGERDHMLTEQDKAFRQEIARLIQERDFLLQEKDSSYKQELQKLAHERDGLLAEKDRAYGLEIERIGRERDSMLRDQDRAFRAEIRRLIVERDKLLSQKDRDYRAEIERIGLERDRLLSNQDQAFRAEIARLVEERNKLLERKDTDYGREIDRIAKERDRLLEAKESEVRARLESRERAHLQKVTQLNQNWQKILEDQRNEHKRLLEAMIGKFNSALPIITIVVVDYNGAHFLMSLFNALERQSYRSFKVLLVINGEFEETNRVASRFSGSFEIKVIRCKSNLGFTGGNNAAFREIDTEYFVLLNNDTEPEPDWLLYLYRRISMNRRFAAVASKVLFSEQYQEVRINSPVFIPEAIGESNDSRKLGLLVSFASDSLDNSKIIYQHGFYDDEFIDGQKWRWTNGNAVAWLPVNRNGATTELIIRAHPAILGGSIEILSGGWTVSMALTELEVVVELGSGTSGDMFDIVNNAGTYVRNEEIIGDIGIFEKDEGQYDQPRTLDAVCGCSIILRREAVGRELFPEEFFAYFEDTDLSLRLRRAGYLLEYEPLSRVRHYHSGSFGTDSPFFNYHVYRNYRWLRVRNVRSNWTVLRLIWEEIRDFRQTVGGLDSTYNSNRLKRDTIKGMIRYAVERFFG